MISIDYQLSDRYLALEGSVFMSGVQALARIPIEQLLRDQMAGKHTAAFVSGYPGSPLGGFDQELARALKIVSDLPIVHQPAVNEELGASAVMGSQLVSTRTDATYEGVVGIWYGKAPGLDRATDALRHGVFAGSSAHGGALALVGDDPAAKSSTMPSSSDAALVDLHMPILYPGTVAECLELGLHGIAMSRSSGLWSALKIVTPVADGNSTVSLPVLRAPIVSPEHFLPDGSLWRPHPSAQFLGPRMVAVEQEFQEIRTDLARQYGRLNQLNRITSDPSDAWLGIVSTGYTYFQVLDCLRRVGLPDLQTIEAAGIRLLHLRMPVPFDGDQVKKFSKGLSEIFVVEEKNPTLERMIRDCLYDLTNRPKVIGKFDETQSRLLPSHGHLDADAIELAMRNRLQERLAHRLTPAPRPTRTLIPLAIQRTPYFCSGCPHSWGTKVPKGSVVGMGTGCHGMTLLMDEERVGDSIGITAMGNEGSQWIGMAPFVETRHVIQNVGDGTYFHSGQLAIQAAIGAGVNITFKILYNDTVAMTGGQETSHRVGVTDLARLLLTHGVQKVVVTTDDTSKYGRLALPRSVPVLDRSKLVAIQADLAKQPGVTVIIHDQACAAELRRGRRRGTIKKSSERIVINHRICEGCGDCGDTSNCLSVQPFETPLGRKTTIEQQSCNIDRSCLKGDCPAFFTVTVDEDAVSADAAAGDTATVHTVAKDDAAGARAQRAGGGLGSGLPDLSAFDVPPPAANHRESTAIRLAGIGGTGVVTVAQVLGAAALLDGLTVDGVDQTGLSQKAGPVLSDVILRRTSVERTSNQIGKAQADVLIAFDQLVGSADSTLLACDPTRTAVIASTSLTPTGAQVVKPELVSPSTQQFFARFAERSDPKLFRSLDAPLLATALTRSPATANILLLGVALQLGHLPLTVASIEQAIALNGVSVEANLAALGWGRRWAHAPEQVEQLARNLTEAGPLVIVADLPPQLTKRIQDLETDDETTALLTMLAGDLVHYQDNAYAERFLTLVDQASATPLDTETDRMEWICAIARSAHKLMAYKDEYEVARLLTGAATPPIPGAVPGVESSSKITWHLHPPMLRRFSSIPKLKIRSEVAPLFRVLAKAKRLRGTAFDPFGRTEIRQLERVLIVEFEAAVPLLCRALTQHDCDLAAACATVGLTDKVRGFEQLKLERAESFRTALAAKLAALDR